MPPGIYTYANDGDDGDVPFMLVRWRSSLRACAPDCLSTTATHCGVEALLDWLPADDVGGTVVAITSKSNITIVARNTRHNRNPSDHNFAISTD